MPKITAEELATMAANCDGTENCGCPVIAYENEDGTCRHKACEGLQEECGEIVAA